MSISSTHLQGLPGNVIPPFLSSNLLVKSRCTLYNRSMPRVPLRLTCKANGSNSDRRNSSHRKKSYQGPPPPPRGKFKNHQDQDDLLETSQMLSSQNGHSTTTDAPAHAKSGSPADIVELFKKHLPQLRESTHNRPGNSNRSYGLNATLLNRDKEDRETFKALLKLLKTSGANQKKPANDVGTKGKSLKYEEAPVEDSESDFPDEDSEFDNDIPDMLDSEPEPITSSRPPSKFSRRSSIPVTKNETISSSETRKGETQLRMEKKSGSKSLLYEPESESEAEEEPVSEAFVYESEEDFLAEGKSESEFVIDESEPVAEESEDPQDEKIEDLSALTVSELREIAKSRGLKGYSKLKKADLLDRLRV